MSHPFRTALLLMAVTLGGGGLLIGGGLYLAVQEAERVTVWAVKPKTFDPQTGQWVVTRPQRASASAELR